MAIQCKTNAKLDAIALGRAALHPWNACYGCRVLGWLAAGMKHEQILSDIPELTDEDILACLAYAEDRERRVTTVAYKRLLF